MRVRCRVGGGPATSPGSRDGRALDRELLARLNEVDESREIEAKRSEAEVGGARSRRFPPSPTSPAWAGGTLVFGVEEEGSRVFTPRGVAHPKKLEQEISSLCASAFNRTVRPRVWTEVIAGARLVAAFVPEAAPSEEPIFIQARGIQHGTFRRIGSTDQR